VPASQIASSARPTRARRAEAEPDAPDTANSADAGAAVVAPLTGVFYTASSPSADPFITEGEPVQAGQIICIVEAMKVFNEIKTEMSGVVVAIPAQNGQLVQRGEVLVRIKPL
jgi:acetyl-CoA carboxylase biotin carboxyl carrier protein